MRSLNNQRAFRAMLVLVWLGAVVVPMHSHAVDAGDLINGEFNAKSRAERVKVAQDVLARVEKLAQFLPTPKPSEQE
jgi:hypothetical protein